MECRLIAPLSATEEQALRRVAHGCADRVYGADVRRLMAIDLIIEEEGRLVLTKEGERRLARIASNVVPWPTPRRK